MAERFSNRQSLVDAATVLAARRAIDKEIALLVADPFDQQAANRLRLAVDANAERAREALGRLAHVSRMCDPWAPEALLNTDSGTGSDDEVAPPIPSPYRTPTRSRDEPTP